MKSFVQILTANSLLLLILGFLSISFYYSFFDINISSYLNVSEIFLLSIPSFRILINTLLFAIIIAGPVFLISFLSSHILQKTIETTSIYIKVSESPIVSKRYLSNRKRNSRTFVILLVVFLASRAIVKILRFAVAVLWSTKEFYLHPTSLLSSLLENLFYLVTYIIFIFLIDFQVIRNRFRINHEFIAKKQIALPLFITMCFLINIYYGYADVCRVDDKVKCTSFTIKTNDPKGIYSSKDYKFIGSTKDYYFLKNETDIIIIKASSVLTHNIRIVNNVDTPGDMDFWNIGYFSIIPPSMQKHK